MKKTLKVKAVPGCLQPNFEAFDGGVRRFVGWKFDASLGDKNTKGQPSGGFVMRPEGEEVPFRAEYVKALKQGMLLPLDYETACLAGLQTDIYAI